MDHVKTYQELRANADKAFEMYQLTQTSLDWDWFNACELKAADYALEYEKEIWDDCGNYRVPNE